MIVYMGTVGCACILYVNQKTIESRRFIDIDSLSDYGVVARAVQRVAVVIIAAEVRRHKDTQS